MKKIFFKILGIVLSLIICYQHFSYADLIVPIIDPIEESKPIAFRVGFILVVVLVISAISFFVLKSTVKKQNKSGYDTEALADSNNEKIEKKKNTIGFIFYICIMILSTLLLIYLPSNWKKPSTIIFFIPIILFIISLIFRMFKKRKISNILCGASVVLICIIVSWSFIISYKKISNDNNQYNMISDYNNQFTKYIDNIDSYYNDPRYTSDIEGLINAAINNNKSGRKITLIYQNTNYTSVDELKQLLNKLNTRVKYSITLNYNHNYYNGYSYIESITLDSYVNRIFSKYKGSHKRNNCKIIATGSFSK